MELVTRSVNGGEDAHIFFGLFLQHTHRQSIERAGKLCTDARAWLATGAFERMK